MLFLSVGMYSWTHPTSRVMPVMGWLQIRRAHIGSASANPAHFIANQYKFICSR